MNILTRQQLIDQLGAVEQGTLDANEFAAWAFDQFYAEEAGTVEFEPGYHRAISAVLDDVMFSDQPGFQLSTVEVQQMIDHLAQAAPTADDDEEDETDVE